MHARYGKLKPKMRLINVEQTVKGKSYPIQTLSGNAIKPYPRKKEVLLLHRLSYTIKHSREGHKHEKIGISTKHNG